MRQIEVESCYLCPYRRDRGYENQRSYHCTMKRLEQISHILDDDNGLPVLDAAYKPVWCPLSKTGNSNAIDIQKRQK